jgi:ElaB/YqjD/DUF883 family membrane-anchored ribosome-binding protein
VTQPESNRRARSRCRRRSIGGAPVARGQAREIAGQRAIDDAVHASKQAIKTVKRRAQDVADLHDEIVHLVRREPVKAVAVAFGAGILVGVVTGIAGLARYDRAYR